MSPLNEIHVVFKSFFGLKHPIKEKDINRVSRKGLQLMLTQSQAKIHPAAMLPSSIVEIYPHTVLKTFYWGQLVEIRHLALEERREINQLSCQHL